MTIKRSALAADLEQIAIDSDAVAKRMASVALPPSVAAKTAEVANAALVLAGAARALHGCWTPGLALFFSNVEPPDDRRHPPAL